MKQASDVVILILPLDSGYAVAAQPGTAEGFLYIAECFAIMRVLAHTVRVGQIRIKIFYMT